MYNPIYTDYDRQVYEKELCGFLPDEFVDAHVHIWTRDMTPQGKSNGGVSWTRLMCDEMTGDQLMDTFKLFFPKQKVTPLVFGSCSKVLKECNDYVEAEANRLGFPTLFRTEYSMSADFVEQEVLRGGFLGLKPYQTNCPEYIPANEIRIFDFLPHAHLEVANKHGWIVMLHIARPQRLRDPVNIAQLMEIEEKYPNVKLIVAHIGRAYSPHDVGNAFEILKNTKNMCFDFTANLCDEAMEACLQAVGPKRLMFGSDLPIAIMRMYRDFDLNTGFYYNHLPRGVYPGAEGSDPHIKISDREDITLMIYESILAFKRTATKLKLTDSQIEDVMSNNALRLINACK